MCPEFYLKAWPALVGKPFKDAMPRLAEAIAIGVKTVDGVIEVTVF